MIWRKTDLPAVAQWGSCLDDFGGCHLVWWLRFHVALWTSFVTWMVYSIFYLRMVLAYNSYAHFPNTISYLFPPWFYHNNIPIFILIITAIPFIYSHIMPLSYHSVDKTIANHLFKKCYLYHLFMVKLWMVYYCFTNIFRIATTTVFLGLETQADPHPRDLELLRLDFSISAETLRPGMIWKRKDII